MTVPPGGDPSGHPPRHARPQRPAGASEEQTQRLWAQRPAQPPQGPFPPGFRPPQGGFGQPPLGPPPRQPAGGLSPRGKKIIQVVAVGVVGLAILGAVISAAIDVRSSSSKQASGIPEQYLNPLGCDSRNGNGFCWEKRAVYLACDYTVDDQATPRFGRDPYNGGSMTSWYDDGQPVATTTIDVRAQTMTLRATNCEVVLPLSEYLRVTKPGPESSLPPALR